MWISLCDPFRREAIPLCASKEIASAQSRNDMWFSVIANEALRVPFLGPDGKQPPSRLSGRLLRRKAASQRRVVM
jgi:hypothetical protein